MYTVMTSVTGHRSGCRPTRLDQGGDARSEERFQLLQVVFQVLK